MPMLNKLYNHRLQNITILNQPFVANLFKVLIPQIAAAQAHFVYELLQNADDAGATYANFELYDDKLVFRHNGTRHFTVSDPNTEAVDAANGTLGDINAITSFGNGAKMYNHATIGKFGIGFKAVFQYTDTPEIYDVYYKFRIAQLVVPVPLKNDYPDRKPDETLFVFPFNKQNVPPNQAFVEISNKLRTLCCPILFLSHLEEVKFKIVKIGSNETGSYEKIGSSKRHPDILEEKICLLKKGTPDETLLLFSRKLPNYHGLRYSVGYFLDNGKNKLKPVNMEAFCFFPVTKEKTELKFIIHAPFLLTPSRDNIKAGNTHNDNLIALLASLAADSLILLRNRNLIDDDIVDIIPTDASKFSAINSQNQISFLPFYDKIKETMKTQELIPANGKYVKSENAYWAEYIRISKLFSNDQLAKIVPNPNAAWAFTSRVRASSTSHEWTPAKSYIDDITKSYLDEDAILKGRKYWDTRHTIQGITANFIENQSIDWLHDFYKWLSETSKRTDMAKTLPLFLDSNGKATAAFLPNGNANLFLPSSLSGYSTVHDDLLDDPSTKNFLINRIGIKAPSLKDKIYKKIFLEYDKLQDKISPNDESTYFKDIFNYYQQISISEHPKYFSDLKEHIWLRRESPNNSINYARPNSLYIPFDYLKKYFNVAKVGRFVDFKFYSKLIGVNNKQYLIEFIEFFKKLGLATEVNYVKRDIDIKEARKRQLPNLTSQGQKWYEWCIEGCHEILEEIKKSPDADASRILWERLVAINKIEKLSKKLLVECEPRSHKKKQFSRDVSELQAFSWLVDNNGNFKNAKTISLPELKNIYDTTSDSAREVIAFLGIKQSRLTAAEARLIAFGQLIEDAIANGLSMSAIQNFLSPNQSQPLINPPPPTETNEEQIGDTSEIQPEKNTTSDNKTDSPQSSPRKKRQPSEIQNDIETINDEEKDFTSNLDGDGITPPTPPRVDSKKKLEERLKRLKRKAELEQEQFEQIENLRQTVLSVGKYSFAWFKACLELECLASRENNIHSKEISISFGRVEKESGTSRTLVLKYPSRFIPQFIEDLENIPLILETTNGTTKVAIEVVSVKHNTLRVKLKDGTQIQNINLNEVREATINAQNPVFLLEELRKQFLKLGKDNNYNDNFNMRDNLCKDIEFIFGPPGTGKTTHLAREVILRIMQEPEDKKILVLIPTNKAADVLTRKIMDCAGKNNINWLIRFGTTDDEIVEQNVFREKTFDIRTKPRNVTVTTIARFPYDYFLIDNQQWHLYNLTWDYIIIDEASMILLANIIFPLYKKQPKKFYIAGDPHQIEPVIALDLWKDENIYTLVELNDFTKPTTCPHNYEVTKLKTQYRSIAV